MLVDADALAIPSSSTENVTVMSTTTSTTINTSGTPGLIISVYICVGCGGSVVRVQDWRPRVLGSNASELWQFHLPSFASVFRNLETLKAVGPFYLASVPGEVKDPTQNVNV